MAWLAHTAECFPATCTCLVFSLVHRVVCVCCHYWLKIIGDQALVLVLLIENCFHTIHSCMWLNTNYLPTRLTTKLLSDNASNLLIYNTFTGQQSKPYITITEECNLISQQVHLHTGKWGYVGIGNLVTFSRFVMFWRRLCHRLIWPVCTFHFPKAPQIVPAPRVTMRFTNRIVHRVACTSPVSVVQTKHPLQKLSFQPTMFIVKQNIVLAAKDVW